VAVPALCPGALCHRWPLSAVATFAGVVVMVAVASVFLLSSVAVPALCPGAPLSSVRLDCQLLPPLPVSW